ncbi:MAG: MFS transporter [Solirubrobacteraceae bacterium]
MRPLLTRFSRTTFASLEVPNYRLYLGGQSLSLVGTWMQTAAQSWLVLTLTRSATDLGLVVALQTLPVLLLSPYGGVIADRVDKRRAMLILQAMMAVQALALGLLTVTHSVHLWEIGALAIVLGLNNAFENPARQSFMLELVGADHLRNAVSLNSTMVNVARVVGPGIGGLLILAVGTGWCFLINAVSFVAVISSLLRMNKQELRPVAPSPRAKGQLRDGLRYVRGDPALLVPLLMAALVGCFAYEFQVSLPYMAQHALHGSSAAYGVMTAAMGLGAVGGGLWLAGRGRTGVGPLVVSATGFGVTIAAAAVAPSLVLELVALVATGGMSIAFMAQTNATLQLAAAPSMRGRVMSLWFVAMQGSTPIGGPVIGFVMADLGARSGLAVGAITCFVAAVAGAWVLRVTRRRADSAAGPTHHVAAS